MSLLIRGRILSVRSKKAAVFINQSIVHTRQMHIILEERRNLKFRANMPSRRFSNEYPKVNLYPLLGSPIPNQVMFKLSIGDFIPVSFTTPKVLTDQNMTGEEFLEATKNAQSVVSEALANEDFEALDGLVTQRAIQILKPKIAELSPRQKRLLNIKKENVTAHQIVGNSKHEDSEGVHVEIETASVYFAEYILMNLIAKQGLPPASHLFMCHYTFRHSENTESWIISRINHSSTMENLKALLNPMA